MPFCLYVSSERLSPPYIRVQTLRVSLQFNVTVIQSLITGPFVPLSAKTVFQPFMSCWELACLLQQFFLFQSKRYAHRHLCDEPFAGRPGHLLAEAKVDLTDASTALKKV